MEYFSDSYQEAREKFLFAAREKGFAIETFIHPIRAQNGGELALDVASLGEIGAPKTLWFSCGTHGLEGAAGSATILQWLDGFDGNLPPDINIIIIHAVNPFGWEYANRGNEDGIDLNRNCILDFATKPQNPAYEDIHRILIETTPDEAGLDEFIAQFGQIAAEKGYNHVVNGVTAGQYEYANGLSFGGFERSWSIKTLLQIADKYLAQVKELVLIDWHTGIGTYGLPLFILDAKKGAKAFEWAQKTWPEEAIYSDNMIEGAEVKYSGLITEGLSKYITAKSGAEIIAMAIEWGTYEVNKMVQALVLDNWRHNNRNHNDNALIEDVKARLIERFYPSDPKWRNSVLERAPRVYRHALKGLNDL